MGLLIQSTIQQAHFLLERSGQDMALIEARHQCYHAVAAGIFQSGGAISLPKEQGRFGWQEDYLIFAVREPWSCKTTKTELVFGVITKDKPLVLAAKKAGQGVIFSDEFEQDYIGFNAGQIAQIGIADQKEKLVICSSVLHNNDKCHTYHK